MKTFERILKDELLARTSHLLDNHQHGFLSKKSCTTNMVHFSDSLVLSLNQCATMSMDVVYFDFSKAFDSVNHDLILEKLKHKYNIDGRLLKFLKNYLVGREQCVIVDNVKSSVKPVLSGVPQGSILGPILFVLFINDLPEGLSHGTNLALYADDTKIWRPITSYLDHEILQKDIDYLNSWAISNKMQFHPQKCKVLSICSRPSPLGMLPGIEYHYSLGDSLLDYADNEKDLGVEININFNFNSQCLKVLSKAKQQFGLTKRTCSFVTDYNRRRVLYLALVRSQFEHCSQVWRPTCKSVIEKFESFPKRCIKWIVSEEHMRYYSYSKYLIKCRQVNLLPISKRFDINDLVLFHKVVYNRIPLVFPEYLSLYDGNTRLRSSHLDKLCFISTLTPRGSSTHLLDKSFFYRTHSLWNSIPLEIREIDDPTQFKNDITKYFWKQILEMIHINESSEDFLLSDND